MRHFLNQKIVFIFWMLFITFGAFSQGIHGIDMQIDSELNEDKKNLINAVVAFSNDTKENFTGYLQIVTPEGFKNISGSIIDVEILSGDRFFTPVKILQQGIALAGESDIEFRLLDQNKSVVLTKKLEHKVAENNNLRLASEAPIVYINNPNDSLVLRAVVSNLGNKRQEVTVVFNIPGLVGENNFFEQKGFVEIQKDTVFTFSFIPPPSLLQQTQFTINVSAMRGVGKELFGNFSVNVQNVSSTQRYNNIQSNTLNYYYQKNSLSASYRKIGKNTDAYQLIGSGDIDLPAGYLSVKGNIYKSNNQPEPIVTNTYVAYKLDNAEVKIGNISEPLELSLFGRGAQVMISDEDENKSLQIGFVDQNYNLFGKEAITQNGYGIYARGMIGESNSRKNTMGTYIFKDDPFERVKHNIFSTEVQRSLNKGWNINLRLHGALSDYYQANITKPSFATEAQYYGSLKEMKLTGNYYFSTDYFPGNRRGMLQIQQNIQQKLSNGSTVYTNISLANFSPRSYAYKMQLESKNIRIDAGMTLARYKNTGISIGYQNQYETSNSYTNFIQDSGSENNLSMNAHRLIENLSWISGNQKHSVFIGLENGLVKYPYSNKFELQLKANATYTYQWLNLNATYQSGSYFLSEYVSAIQQAKTFERLMVSAAVNKNFLQNKLFVNSGFGYINDFLSGETPSGFLNLKYSPSQKYFLYVNSSWYRYKMTGISSAINANDIFTIEAGITVNFQTKQVSKGKKSRIQALVYYDKNTNNIYDEGDEVASDYFITMNNTSFKTDKNGEFVYSSVPFGTYKIKPTTQGGWFTTERKYQVDTYHTNFEIPLHQSGTVSGKIKYDYDPKKVLDFDPKTGGIVINIFQNGVFVQKAATDDFGNFTTFLQTGTYEVILSENSLLPNTYCDKTTHNITVEAGKITTVPAFVIGVKERKMNIKRFGS